MDPITHLNGETTKDNAKTHVPRNVLDSSSLQGRTIVITGAAGGLGLSFTKACVEAGASVAGIDMVDAPDASLTALQSTGRQVEYFRADVTEASVVERTVQDMVSKFGTIDGCITCAGIAGESPFHEYPEDKVKEILNVNLLGSFFTAQSVVRQFIKEGKPGSIVFIFSVASHQANRAHPVSAYGVTKYAVRGLAQQVAAEYAGLGIRANSISPGPMMTDMTRRLAAGNAEVYKNLCAHIMLGRLGEPDELNGAAVFLLSEASSFVTGEDILVDGGRGHL